MLRWPILDRADRRLRYWQRLFSPGWVLSANYRGWRAGRAERTIYGWLAGGMLLAMVSMLPVGLYEQVKAEREHKAELEALLVQARGAGVGQWADADDLLTTHISGRLAPLDDMQAVAAITLRILRLGIPQQQADGTTRLIQASYPTAHRTADAIVTAARAEEIPAWLLAQTIEHESHYNAAAIGPANPTGDLARGLGQVMPKTWVGRCPGVTELVDLHVPERNARCSAYILKEYLQLADGDVKRALLLYNRGPGAVAADERRGFPIDNGYPAGVLARKDS